MPLYCQWKDPEDKGRPAVNKIYEDTKTKIAGGATVSLDDLAPLHMYQWQLSNEEVQDIKVWTDKCLESLQIVSTLPISQSAASSTATTKKSNRAMKSAQGLTESVDNLFS